MRAGILLLLRQPSRVEVIHSTPVGFAALAHTRCAFFGQFTLSITPTARLVSPLKFNLRLAQTHVNNQYLSLPRNEILLGEASLYWRKTDFVGRRTWSDLIVHAKQGQSLGGSRRAGGSSIASCDGPGHG